MNKNQEFLLSVQYNNIDGEIDFLVNGAKFSHIENDLHVYKGYHSFTGRSQVTISLLANRGSQSHITIKNISINGTSLDNMQNWSVCVDSETGQSSTSNFGYMSRPGKYFLNIKQSPIVHNYINYFLSRCKKV
jgi:hypothetical protein